MKPKSATLTRVVPDLTGNGVALPSDRAILRLPLVKANVGMSRSWIYAGVKAGTFPKPVNVGPKAVGWLAEEIAQYIEALAASRSGVAATQEGL